MNNQEIAQVPYLLKEIKFNLLVNSFMMIWFGSRKNHSSFFVGLKITKEALFYSYVIDFVKKNTKCNSLLAFTHKITLNNYDFGNGYFYKSPPPNPSDFNSNRRLCKFV